MARTVVVTLDGSRLSESVLHYVPALVRPNDEIVLLRVAPYPRAQVARRLGTDTPVVFGSTIAKLEPDPVIFAEDEAHAIDRSRSEIRDYLQDRALFLRNEGLSVTCEALIDNDPAAAIIRFVKSQAPLFVAMATHGRGGFDHAVHGSITEKVIRSGVAPVTVIRPEGLPAESRSQD